MPDLEPTFQAIHHLALGEWVRSQVWRVPAVEIVHIVGIVLLFGSLLVVNLRLFRLILRSQPPKQLWEDVLPIQKLGFLFIVLSGPVLFVTSAVKMYHTESFWWKMGFLATALAYQFGVHGKLVQRDKLSVGQGYLTAAISMALWCSVLFGGMWTLLA